MLSRSIILTDRLGVWLWIVISNFDRTFGFFKGFLFNVSGFYGV